MEAVSQLTREKTVILIAHRLKTVRHADQILVDKGQIAQHSTHDALMAQDGIYRRFLSMCFLPVFLRKQAPRRSASASAGGFDYFPIGRTRTHRFRMRMNSSPVMVSFS